MLVSDFDYHLPEELIAKQPLADRAAARMLHLDRRPRQLARLAAFANSPTCCAPTIYWCLTTRRVLPARLFGHRSGSRAQRVSAANPAAREFLRGKVEVLLTKQLSTEPNEWEALVHPGRKLGIGERVYFGGDASEQSHELAAEIVARGDIRRAPSALRSASMISSPCWTASGTFRCRLTSIAPTRQLDREQYQTVYAKPLGSVAAPTAGLHFTPEILDRIRARGIETAEVTLHVGLGTFQPVRVEVVEEHKLHREWYEISPEAAEKIQRARDAGRRIVAVGTTTVRTLEYRGAPDRPTAASSRKAARPTSSSIPDSSSASSAPC